MGRDARSDRDGAPQGRAHDQGHCCRTGQEALSALFTKIASVQGVIIPASTIEAGVHVHKQLGLGPHNDGGH